MAIPLWRRNLQPASFRGVPFHVRIDAKAGGRRQVTHEFPKKDQNYTEDMGRRARRFRVTAYILYNPVLLQDYESARDQLVDALESSDGPGQLVHPTMGVDLVSVETYVVTEHQEAGGLAEFEIEFIEAGTAAFSSPSQDTNGAVGTAAQSAITQFQSSSQITSL